jgi:hypothetical protein
VIWHLTLGSIVIAICVAVQAEMFALLSDRFDFIRKLLRPRLKRFANTGIIIVAVLYVLLVETINVWIWALVFIAVGAIPTLEPAVYFSLTCFTTLGIGDIALDPNWRLLSGLTAANGFLSFGWSTAYMVELVRRTA